MSEGTIGTILLGAALNVDTSAGTAQIDAAGVTAVTGSASPGATLPVAAAPTAVDVVNGLPAAVADLAAKKAAYEAAKGVVAGMKAVWMTAVTDIEAAFADAEGFAGELIKEVGKLI